MCEIKTTIKFSFCKESDKPNIGEAVIFVKSLDADHGQVDAIYRMAEESAIYVKWKSEEAMLHVLTHNSDDLIFHYANGKQTSICMSHAQDYILYVRIYGSSSWLCYALEGFCLPLNLVFFEHFHSFYLRAFYAFPKPFAYKDLTLTTNSE